jgi:hypothetical protein
MKIRLLMLLMCGLLCIPPAVHAEPLARGKNALDQQIAALQYQAKEIAKTREEKPSRSGLTIIPQFYFSHNDKITTNLSDGMGGKLEVGSGHASGGGFVFLATKEINKTLALTFYYQFVSMDYSGGALHPNSIQGLDVREDIRAF